MAENPATWGPAERVIEEALNEHFDQMSEGICGFSLEHHIADKLRQHHLLKDEAGSGEDSRPEDKDQSRRGAAAGS